MQGIRTGLFVVGGAALMALMLGAAAFAFSAAVQPDLLAHPAAIVVGFAAAADAEAVPVTPIVTGIPTTNRRGAGSTTVGSAEDSGD